DAQGQCWYRHGQLTLHVVRQCQGPHEDVARSRCRDGLHPAQRCQGRD
ncbi:hypothetical protein BN1708_020132, partial [Verticillium longisporum]